MSLPKKNKSIILLPRFETSQCSAYSYCIYLLFRSKRNPDKPVKLTADGRYKPHVNSFVNQVPNKSPVRKPSPVKSHVSPMVIVKKEITTPVSFCNLSYCKCLCFVNT